MIIQMFSIYDVKAKAYNRPFFMLNEDVALRACKVMVKDEKSDYFHNPQDFVLYRIGLFDDNDGIFNGNIGGTPEHIADFKSLV